MSEECVLCGAIGVRGRDGSIAWLAKLGHNAPIGPHEHETIEGDR